MNLKSVTWAIWLFASLESLIGQESGNVIPFQGQLANQAGQPLTNVSSATLVFRLYQTPVGGVAIWEEAQLNISVNAGRFSVLLGSRNALPAYTNFNATLYLGITVDDGNPATADVEMRPRQALVPVISASYAKEADKLDGYDWSALFGASNPGTGYLLDSKIKDGSIQANKLMPESIHAGLIVSNTITAGQIAPGTLTPAEIKPASLTLSALAKEVLDQLVPAGTIIAFGGDTDKVPNGWLLCDGRGRNSLALPGLYSAITTNWGTGGGPGSANDFNLPDLRGMFLRGVSGTRSDGYQDPDATSGRTNAIPVGVASENRIRGGNTGNAVGSVQMDGFTSHTHNMSKGQIPAGGTLTGPYMYGGLSDGDRTGQFSNVIRETGGNETRSKNVYVNFIIKY